MIRMVTAWLAALLFAAAGGGVRAETPRFLIYYNSDASPASDLLGTPYTHVILSFVTVDPQAQGPRALVVDPRLEAPLKLVSRLRADGKKVLVSFGGGDMPADAWRAAVGREDEVARALADFVAAQGLDGVDIDFEISAALHRPLAAGMFDGRKLLIGLSQALRRRLHGGALVTHAPQAPYLNPHWHGGPYLAVLAAAGSAIDWVTVQYYNNPDFDLPVETRIVGPGAKPYPSSYGGIVSGRYGLAWPAGKTLVGLPVYRADAANGHQPPEVVRAQILAPLIAQHGEDFGGLAGWQFSVKTPDHRAWNAGLGTFAR